MAGELLRFVLARTGYVVHLDPAAVSEVVEVKAGPDLLLSIRLEDGERGLFRDERRDGVSRINAARVAMFGAEVETWRTTPSPDDSPG